MKASARSVCYFGFYLYAVGLTLVFIPNIFLGILQMPETSEVWIRVTGLLAFLIGFYYHRTGAANLTAFFKFTIPTRVLLFIAFLAFALLKYVSPVLIAVGAVDLAGAIWTYVALRSESQL